MLQQYKRPTGLPGWRLLGDRTLPGGTECRTFPGLGGSCILPGSGVTAQGTLHYERRQPNASLSGYTAPTATGWRRECSSRWSMAKRSQGSGFSR